MRKKKKSETESVADLPLELKSQEQAKKEKIPSV